LWYAVVNFRYISLTQLLRLQEVFDAPFSKKDKKRSHDYKDSEYYLSYVQKDADTEKGWACVAQHLVPVSNLISIQVLPQGWCHVRRASSERYI